VNGSGKPPERSGAFAHGADGEARLRRLVREHFDFVWRAARRLGLSTSDADDAAQEVFVVLARRLAEVDEERVRGFLFQSVVRVVSTRRRSSRRRGEHASGALDERASAEPDPERMRELGRAREQLRALLDAMPEEQRAVFVLYELEELNTPEIARLLELPVGTVSSRLRAARQAFSEGVQRLHAKERNGHVDTRR
jgi:RNA polymerase sigma-70 factor, ECF subfamily